METKKENCLCGAGDYIVMACYGATDIGFVEGKTPVTESYTQKVYEKAEPNY